MARKRVVTSKQLIVLDYPPFSRGDKDKVFVQWANSTFKPDGQLANDNTLYGRVSCFLHLFFFIGPQRVNESFFK